MTAETTFAYSAGTSYSDNGLHEGLSSAIECLRPVVAAIDQLLKRLAGGGFTWRISGSSNVAKARCSTPCWGKRYCLLPKAKDAQVTPDRRQHLSRRGTEECSTHRSTRCSLAGIKR